MPRTVTVERALASIPPGARIVASPASAAPTTLLAGLADLATRRPDLGFHLYAGLQPDDQPFVDAVAAGHLRFTTWFVAGPSRELIRDGRGAYLPVRLSDVPGLLARLPVDVALVRVGPPDARGMVSLGPSLSYSRAAVDTARVVIAEVDPALPRTHGPTRLPVDRITAFVDSDRPTPTFPSARPSAVATTIAGHIAARLPPAPTLQLGLGQVPDALAATLVDRGIGRIRAIGLATDSLVDLAEAGLLDLSPHDPTPVALVRLMGTERLWTLAAETPQIGLYPSPQGHDPRWLSRHFDRLVSVNSAIEVDLSGQVNAETLEGHPIAGIGGSADFVDAARASDGGCSIIALPAAARGGAVSRIVPRLDADAATTIPRHAYDLVVTEHGVADLRGRTVAQRAEALVAIADPAHRDALAAAWRS